ncbi:MAG TPA: helix-turn-helix domain-containing protein [Solirubrobacterales bacterium]|nr:helix-turn-helix domain-containing protein [Solirubrobacterales bacterium]
MPTDPEERSTGRREQRKRRIRTAIAEAAERLFAERGYDQVTVAEIAAEAGVSVKTLFTYFDSKEDLVFADEERLLGRLLESVQDRPAGRTPLEAVTAVLLAALDEEDGPEGLEEFHRTIGSSAGVASRLRRMWEAYEVEMAALLAGERNEAVPSPETRLAAAQLIALVRITASAEALSFVRSRRSADPEEPALREWIERSAAQLGAGLADYGRRAADRDPGM